MKGVVNVKRTNPMNVVKRIKGSLTRFLKEEDGVGVVEVVLILVVLISLVVIFKQQLTSLVKNILSKIIACITPDILIRTYFFNYPADRFFVEKWKEQGKKGVLHCS